MLSIPDQQVAECLGGHFAGEGLQDLSRIRFREVFKQVGGAALITVETSFDEFQ